MTQMLWAILALYRLCFFHCITHLPCIYRVGVELASLGFIRTGAQAQCSHRGPLQQMKRQGAYTLFRKPCLMYLAGT